MDDAILEQLESQATSLVNKAAHDWVPAYGTPEAKYMMLQVAHRLLFGVIAGFMTQMDAEPRKELMRILRYDINTDLAEIEQKDNWGEVHEFVRPTKA